MNKKGYVSQPMVTAIICTYNQQDSISQTIESVLSQQCDFPYEIIIGEDCSTDGTKVICEEYQKKYPEILKVLSFENNGGVVNNWLSCIKEASGKYIATCAGDDYWHNIDKLQLQINYMEAHPACGVVHTDFDQLNIISNQIIKSYYTTNKIEIPTGFVQKELFNGTLKMTAPTICIRKDFFDKYIPVNDYLELDFPIEDWPTLIILSYYSEINYLPVSTVTYRVGQESISNPQSYQKIIQRFAKEKQMYKYLCYMFPDDLSYDENGYNVYVQGILLGLAYKKNDFVKAKEFATHMLALGDTALRTRLSNHWLSFQLFRLMKMLKK